MPLRRAALSFAFIALSLSITNGAQLPTLRPEDSTRWETLVPSSPHLGMSPDGSVLAYRIDRSNWDDELRIVRASDGKSLVVPFGHGPEFSSNGQWLTYSIGHSKDEEAQLKRDRRPVRDGLGLLQLSTFSETRLTDVEESSFSADGEFLAIERYTPRANNTANNRRSDAEPPHLFVRSLTAATHETAFDNVQQFVWQPDHGHLLAMNMGGDNQGSARVQVFNPQNPTTTIIDNAGENFSRLSWRPGGTDLVYLRSRNRSADGAAAFDVVVARNADRPTVATTAYDSSLDASFPANTRVVDFREPSWSSDGRTIFVGIAGADSAADPQARAARGANVRIWHWTDVEVMPRQVENLDAVRRRNRLAAVNFDTMKLVPLAMSLTARASPIHGTPLAWAADWTPYALERTLGRPSADLALVDTRTGERAQFAANVDDSEVRVRPDGGALVFLRSDHLWSLNTATRKLTDLSAATPSAAFVDLASDDTAAHKPLFGVAGWSSDGALLAYDRYDVWRIPVDGSAAKRLTDGAGTRTRHRIAQFSDDGGDQVIDMSRPLYVELFGERTKQSGYARLTATGVERLIYQDRRIDRLASSADGRVYGYVSQNFDASPNIFLGSGSLADARAVTNTNPQQSQYAWGHSGVIDYTTTHGDALQAAVYYPAGYTAGKRYPTVVKLYERLSDDVHNYTAPSDMDEANIAIFTALGYVVIAPDIAYRPRDPGGSTVECATAAVARAIALGVTDSAHVGVIGHSWGAYESAFLATHTNGVFAAAVAGAAITDLISQYGDHHWSTGVAETDHIETGQQRMQVPYYDDVDAYVRNSPIFGVGKMTTPLLLETGDQDGEVFWHQSIELYNAARRAKKPVVMLQYPDEDHALASFDDRRDYQRRILAWFGHYLKNEAAPAWITTGTPLVKRTPRTQPSGG